MKKTILLLLFVATFLNSQDIDISKIKFKIDKTSSYKKTFTNIRTDIFNISYSSVLPVNGIYKVVCISNNREAIIQIGYSMTTTAADTIYMTDILYSFFTDNDPGFSGQADVKLTFLGWSQATAGDNDFLNIQSLIVSPDNADATIRENGKDKFYIQLGSFGFYQNSYPKITQLLPYLELKPNFYMMEFNDKGSKVYRVLAGPYTRDDALKITKLINAESNDKVFIKQGESIIKQDK